MTKNRNKKNRDPHKNKSGLLDWINATSSTENNRQDPERPMNGHWKSKKIKP
jgi:hypothetical protein